MKYITFAFSAIACIGSASAHGWYNNSVITTEVTVTGYTTYCPVPTVITVTTCSDHKCEPETITASEQTTLTVTGECLVSTTITPGAPSESKKVYETTSKNQITSEVTVIGFTTYCPQPTIFTLTTCSDHRCAPEVITASSETTFTFTGECVIPTTIIPGEKTFTGTNTKVYPTGVTVTGFTTYCPESTVFTISTCENHVCYPTTCTASEKTTFTFPGECVIPTSVSTQIAYTSTEAVITSAATVTGYTTYCPEYTVFTISTCENHVCYPTTCTASEATTFTFPGECIVPSYITPEVKTKAYPTEVTVTGFTTYCPESTVFTISTCENHVCFPTRCTASEATTFTFPGECVVPSAVISEAVTSTQAVITTAATVTGYTTYCPESTVFTVSTCENHVCYPTTCTASEATTFTFPGECVVPTTITPVIVKSTESLITSEATVTGFTTFCPESTVFTISTCHDEKCAPTVISVSEATTLSFVETCVVPTVVTSNAVYTATKTGVVVTTEATVTGFTTYCPSPTVFTISSCNEKECIPSVVSVTEATTLSFLHPIIVPSVYTTSVPETTAEITKAVVTTEATVTGFTTYLSSSTAFTISACNEQECVPSNVSVSEATTLSFTYPVVVPTVITTNFVETTAAFVKTEVSQVTSQATVTGFTTYLSSSSIFTVSICNEHECAPSVVSVSEATTLTFTHPLLVSTTYSTAVVVTETAAATTEAVTTETKASVTQENSVVSAAVTVTGFTTYCPSSTVLTLTTCSSDTCSAAIISVSEATTLSFTHPVVVTSAYTTAVFSTTYAVSTASTLLTVSGSTATKTPAVTTAEAGAAKIVARGAGLIGFVALLI